MGVTNLNYKQEVYRKLIHVSSLWMPACIWLLEPLQWQILLYSAFAFVILFEIIRRRPAFIRSNISKLLNTILRQYELAGNKQLTGSFYMLLGAVIVTLIAPREIAATSLCVLMISDSFAALIGKRWGKHPIMQKSLEGTAAFFLSALAITAFFAAIGTYDFQMFFISGCVACIVSTLCELYAKRLRLDDNLLIPVAFAVTQLISLSLLDQWMQL